MCGSGPLSEREISELQKADGTKPTPSQKKTKKHGYLIQNVAVSPSSSASKEVLTILDSDEEEDKPLSPKKDVKGKGKAVIASITLDSDSSDEEQDEEDEDASEDYLPSPPPRNGAAEDDDEDIGGLEDSDDEDDGVSGKKAVALSKGDFRSSTKLDALVSSLKAAKAKDANLKAVVFSQVR